MEGSLFSRFYSIWETRVEGSIEKQDQRNFIYSKNTVLGNVIKRKRRKTLQGDFPNFTGPCFSEYKSCFFIIGKDTVTKSSKYEFKWLISY